MIKKILKVVVIILLVVIGLFLVIQFIPYGKDYINPPVVSEPNWDNPQTRELAKKACFDCHSNETVWPWYSKIAPVSWLVYRDVVEGRQLMNFSDWGNSYITQGNEIAAVVNEGEMPPFQYLLMHSSARMSASEKTQLITGMENTLNR